MKKVFGIISYIPDKEPDRAQRIDRLERLFKQLFEFWPNIPIMVISQNWKTYMPDAKYNIINYAYGKLGIIGARKTLRQRFLESEFDYLIMYDDDAIIECATKESPKKYADAIDSHPDGFMFLQYKSSQLNGCAISRAIYEKEPMVNIDAQNNEGFEDAIFSCLLHNKYPEKEFTSNDIKCTHFRNAAETAPSTWANEGKKEGLKLRSNTAAILDYITKYKELPDLDVFLDKKLDLDENCYMQLSGNCTALGYLGTDRIRGPVDNVVTNGVECMKLLLSNNYYNKVINDVPKQFNRRPSFKDDSVIGYEYPFVQIVHGNPKAEDYKAELRKRCNTFNTFYEKLKQCNNYYFTINLNAYEVDNVTHELKGNALEEELAYLKSLNLLNKLIIVGTRRRDRNDTANWWSEKATALISSYGIKYIEIIDNDLANVDAMHLQFIDNIKNINAKVNFNTIDIVIPYVDAADPEWYTLYQKALPNTGEAHPEINSLQRFRGQGDFFRYWFRGVEKYAPWIRKIHLLVQNESQVPKWLNRDKVHVVLHKDFIPTKFLPIFNSTAIEMFIWNIPELAEKFIYFNDDIYFIGKTMPEAFFAGDFVLNSTKSVTELDTLYGKHILNGYCKINRKSDLEKDLLLKTNQCQGFNHTARPHLKSLDTECYMTYKTDIDASISAFRAPQNFNIYLYEFYTLAKNKALPTPQELKFNLISTTTPSLAVTKYLTGDSNLLCINDTHDTKNIYQDYSINVSFKNRFPIKSSYELNDFTNSFAIKKEEKADLFLGSGMPGL